MCFPRQNCGCFLRLLRTGMNSHCASLARNPSHHACQGKPIGLALNSHARAPRTVPWHACFASVSLHIPKVPPFACLVLAKHAIPNRKGEFLRYFRTNYAPLGIGANSCEVTNSQPRFLGTPIPGCFARGTCQLFTQFHPCFASNSGRVEVVP